MSTFIYKKARLSLTDGGKNPHLHREYKPGSGSRAGYVLTSSGQSVRVYHPNKLESAMSQTSSQPAAARTNNKLTRKQELLLAKTIEKEHKTFVDLKSGYEQAAADLAAKLGFTVTPKNVKSMVRDLELKPLYGTRDYPTHILSDRVRGLELRVSEIEQQLGIQPKTQQAA